MTPPIVVRVLRAGMQSLVVDRGRFGLRDRGVAWCGAMDRYALGAANALLGNGVNAAAVEVAYGGVEFAFEAPVRVALAGADCLPELDGTAVPTWAAFDAAAGSRLRLRRPREWARTIVAFQGGIDVAEVLGSRTTDCTARIGGIGGRALRAGDGFPIGSDGTRDAAGAVEVPKLAERIRVIAEPGYDSLWEQTWRIGHESNRTAWRLYGTPMPHRDGTIPTRGVFPGVIQLPPAGEPIVLGSDAPVTGGYPIAGVVAEADLWMLAQIPHGAEVRFQCMSI
jgi:5-oxoprolinase (ATP-hydrolysing) subunit C